MLRTISRFIGYMHHPSGILKRSSPDTKSPTDGPSVKRTFKMPSEAEQNEHGDATHARLDQRSVGLSPNPGPPMDEPSAKYTLETTLKAVPNDLDDDTHARLDKSVLETADYDPSTLPTAGFLLVTIVANSEGKLDPKYENTRNAKALLEEHPGLMGKLKEAWAARSFREIRNLSELSRYDEHQMVFQL